MLKNRYITPYKASTKNNIFCKYIYFPMICLVVMCICLKYKYILNLKVNNNIEHGIFHFRLHKKIIIFWEQLTMNI
jgi:hypothetical protein